MSSADPTVSARGKELLERAIDVTTAIGAGFLGGVVHSAMGKYPVPPTERGRLVAALRRLAEHAQRGGVTIGVEA